ncbi:MAG: hypothetical protein JWM10_2932 [Myxococcaceae bacterium]|nr:hypothetical protein [Myxococcaceae bacterium]
MNAARAPGNPKRVSAVRSDSVRSPIRKGIS